MTAEPRTIGIDALPAHPGYRALAAIAGLQVDLRYAGTRNLLGRDLYSPHDCAWLRREAADALAQSVRWLQRERPELRLLVLDAARPQRVQELFWAHVQGTPMEPYFAPPQRGSIHSFGMAVDATLLDAAGREVDMGSGFDEMSLRSHPARQAELLAQGELTPAQVAERETLARALAAGGFAGIDIEWWHFDCGDVEGVRREFARIL